MPIRLILVDRDKEFSDVLRGQFRSHPEVQVFCGRFEDLPSFDCVVTAGNSFGLMDAGMDLAVVRFFGRQVMERIQTQILQDYLGEQPVGTCIIVPTDHATHPFVAHAPTMRVPMNIQGTDHVYLAMWAALTAVHRHNRSASRKVDSLACPGLGTGTGGMDSLEAALQLCLAYEHYQRPPQFINPSVAQQRHERVYYGGRWGFTQPRKTGPPEESDAKHVLMRTILIVDDSEDDALLLMRCLKKSRIENPVQVAADASAALAYLDSEKPCPGIIFVDLRMPGITGLELITRIKARPDCADVLLFVVSAHDKLERVREAYALGANSFVSKPVRSPDVENLIQGFPRHWVRSSS